MHNNKGRKLGGGGNNNGGGNNSSLDNYYGSAMGEKIHQHHYPNYEYNSNNELRSKSAGISGSTTTWGGGSVYHGGINGSLNRLTPLGSNLPNHHGISAMGSGGETEDHLSRSSSLDSGRLGGTLPRFVHSAPAVARSLNLPPLQACTGPSPSHTQHSYNHNIPSSHLGGQPPFSMVQFSRSQSDFSDIRSASTSSSSSSSSNMDHQPSPLSTSSLTRHT